MTDAGIDAGVTLVEMLVALAVFAAIGLAGVTLLDTMLGVERQTAGRLARLTDIERTLAVIDRDVEMVADGPFGGDARTIGFVTRARDGGRVAVRYAVADGVLRRVRDGRTQRVLAPVAGVRWRFLGPRGWQDGWAASPAWPRAIAADIDLGRDGTVRRVLELRGRAA